MKSFFGSVLKNIARGLSTEQACEVGAVGAMTKGHIAIIDQRISYYSIYCQGVKLRYFRWKYFGWRKEIGDVILQWLHFARARHHIAMAVKLFVNVLWAKMYTFVFLFLFVYVYKQSYLVLDSGLYRKIEEAVRTFSNWLPGNKDK